MFAKNIRGKHLKLSNIVFETSADTGGGEYRNICFICVLCLPIIGLCSPFNFSFFTENIRPNKSNRECIFNTVYRLASLIIVYHFYFCKFAKQFRNVW